MKKALSYMIAFVLIVGLSPLAMAQTATPTPMTPPTGAVGNGGAPWPHGDHHPEIRRAIHVLEKAKEDLEHAAHDYAGHREKAIQDIDAALGELQQALQVNE